MSKKLKETIKMLNKRTVSMKVISSDNNVSERWLYKLADDEFKDPGINRIERLYDYLKN